MKLNKTKKFYYSIGLVFVILIIVLLSFVVSPFAKNNIPSSFNNTRADAGRLSQNIVSMLDKASKNIEQLQNNNSDKPSKLLAIVLKSIQYTRSAREKASDLASNLEKMAIATPNISPIKSRQTAIVAISVETALINKLISYNDGLMELLNLLQSKYKGSSISVNKINNAVDNINKNANGINQLNSRYIYLMKKFDNYY